MPRTPNTHVRLNFLDKNSTYAESNSFKLFFCLKFQLLLDVFLLFITEILLVSLRWIFLKNCFDKVCASTSLFQYKKIIVCFSPLRSANTVPLPD